jgi:hypothetical protein
LDRKDIRDYPANGKTTNINKIELNHNLLIIIGAAPCEQLTKQVHTAKSMHARQKRE